MADQTLMDEKEEDALHPGLEPHEQKMDLSGLDAVPLKKTLLMINSFALNTTAFLNKFAALCESKLGKLSADIQRVEIVLALLEAKLNSIPWLESAPPPSAVDVGGPPPPPSDAVPGGAPAPAPGPPVAGPPAAGPPNGAPAPANAAPPVPPPLVDGPPAPPPADAVNEQALVPVEEPQEEAAAPSAADDPRYVKYFRMMKLGVLKDQIIQRMQMDGVNPAILDGAAPPPAPAAAAVESDVSDD